MLSTDHLEVIEFSLTPTPNDGKLTFKLPEIDMLEQLTHRDLVPGAQSEHEEDGGHHRFQLPEDHTIDKGDLQKMIQLVQAMDPVGRHASDDRPRLDTALTTNTDTESYGAETCIIEDDESRDKSLSPQSELQPLEFNPDAHSFMTEDDDNQPPPGTLDEEPSRSLFLESECPTLFKTDTNPHRSHRPTMEVMQPSDPYPLSDLDVMNDAVPTQTHHGPHHPQYAEYQSPPEHYSDGNGVGGAGAVIDQIHRRDRPSETPSEEDYLSGAHLEIPPSNPHSSSTLPSVSTMPPMGHTVDRRDLDRAIGRQLSSSAPTSILDVLSDSESATNGSCLSVAVWHKLAFIMFLLSSCILSTHLLCDEESAKYKMMAAVIGNVLSAFFCYLFHSLWKSQKLHQVKVITTSIDPYFGALSLPTQIEEDQTRPIFSISELVGFRGSSLYLLFLISSVSIAAITSLAVMTRWVELHEAMTAGTGYADTRYPLEVVAIAFALCAPLIRFFDLSAYDEVAGWRVLDMADLVLSFMGTFAFGVQSEWSSGSVWLINATLVFVIMWAAMTRYYSKDLSIDLIKVHSEHSTYNGPSNWTEEALFRKVHIISLRCVVVEALARMCCLVSVFLYVWNLEDVHMVTVAATSITAGASR